MLYWGVVRCILCSPVYWIIGESACRIATPQAAHLEELYGMPQKPGDSS